MRFTLIISMSAYIYLVVLFMSQRRSVDRNMELELYRDIFLLTLGKHRDAYCTLIHEYGSYQALLTRHQRARNLRCKVQACPLCAQKTVNLSVSLLIAQTTLREVLAFAW